MKLVFDVDSCNGFTVRRATSVVGLKEPCDVVVFRVFGLEGDEVVKIEIIY